jgi:Lar family restriction alleviation protein
MTDKYPRLDSCPFCGGEATMMHQSLQHYVMCRACHATSRLCEKHEQAVEAWNLRNDMSYALADGLEKAHAREDSQSAALAARDAEIARLRWALEQLARLGNGDKYGNSIGNRIAQAALSQPASAPATQGEDCGNCHKCLEGKAICYGPYEIAEALTRMIVCPVCGNKRCPKATDHHLDCTGSNEPGQTGSVYGAPATQVEPVPEVSRVELGVIELHPKAALRDDFYRVADDLRRAGSIVDVWLMDIATTLKRHGYRMEVYRDAAAPKEPK